MPAQLIERLLTQQHELTAVERFSQRYTDARQPALEHHYRDLIPLSTPGPGEQYAFEVDLDACTGCKACVSACHSLNGLDEDEAWRDVGLLLSGPEGGESFQQHVTTACHHCLDPACANGCPVLAYEKDPETGIVRHLDDQCIGCQYCVMKCPYEVPKYSKTRGIVRKCDMCHGRLAEGEAPACVQACPNEAIRIRVVRQEDVAKRSGKGDRLVPGAFDSSYTQPSTRFIGAHTTREMARSGDAESLAPQPAHWPLVWMLTLTQISLGLLVVSQIHGNALVTISSGVIGAIGLITSALHLGRPMLAWKAFLGLQRSWLSREIVAFGAWMPLVIGYAILDWNGFPLAKLVGSGALVLGTAAVFCSAMVYVDTGRDFWRASRTFPLFFGTALASGAAMDAVLRGNLTMVLVAVVLAQLAELTFSLLVARRGESSPPRRSARVMWHRLRPLTIARTVLPLAGLFIFTAGAMPEVGFVLILLGEVAGRALFFKAVTAPTMPKGLAV